MLGCIVEFIHGVVENVVVAAVWHACVVALTFIWQCLCAPLKALKDCECDCDIT